MTHQNQKSEKGFTLVELAIVLIIVGLLIGGILQGQELIRNSQITATATQAQAVEAALNSFRDSFGTFPGDLEQANIRLPNCAAAPCLLAAAPVSNGRIDTDPGAAVAATQEGLAAFAQMAAADLISGVNPTPVNAALNLTDEVLETELGGSGFTVGYVTDLTAITGESGTTPWTPGHYIGFTGVTLAAVATGAGNTTNAFEAEAAAKIDSKIDDSRPNTGTVRAGGPVAAGECANAADLTGIYANQTLQSCTVFIKVQ